MGVGLGIDQQIWFPVFTLVLGYVGKMVGDLVIARQQHSYLLDDRNYQNSIDRWSGQRQAVIDTLAALQSHQADWMAILMLKSGASLDLPNGLGDLLPRDIFLSARKVVHTGYVPSDPRAVSLTSLWYVAFLDALAELYQSQVAQQYGRTIAPRVPDNEIVPKRENQTAGEYFVEVERLLEGRLTTMIREFNERALTSAPCHPVLTSP
jgi:hypothetical protein